MKIEHNLIKNWTGEVFTEMGKIFSQDKVDIFKKNFDENYESIDPEVVSPCIEKLVQAELDYTTPGDRGLGRLTETLPRLGAYFREPIAKLDDINHEKLDALITRIITKGYIFVSIVHSKPKEKISTKTENQLYEEWIPKIFTFDLNNISNNAGDLLLAVTKNDFDEIKNFFNQYGMRASGFFSRDKSDDILMHYLIAGASLYFIEKLKVD